MIFIALLFLFISTLLIYKNMNNFSTKFLYGLIIGLTITYVSFILYLSKFNFYYNTISHFFNFNPGTWNYLVLQNFNAVTLIRFMNFGTLLFYFSFLCFTISFTNSNRNKRKLIRVYIWLSLITFIQFLFYDPKINIFIQDYAFQINFLKQYHLYSKIGNVFFHILNAAYLLIGILLLVHYYFRHFRIRFLKNYTIFTLFSLLPLIFVYMTMFYWAPDILVKTTFIEGVYNYKQPDFNAYFQSLHLFPAITLLALSFMVFNVYRYNSIENFHKEFNVLTERKIDTASLGVRAFTHSVKNHLLAIRSEAEYLKEQIAGDEDAQYSLNLILSSCEQSFNSINDATMKLKHIVLTLKLIELHLPVEKVVHQLNLKESNISVRYQQSNEPIHTYIDETYLQEAVYNITKNAMEAISKENGIITIEVRRIDKWGVITISDNGPGIANENLNDLFTPFYSTKSSVTNWGIGLSFCYKIVKGHDGKIEVNSILGKGTQFDIFIPIFTNGE